MNGHRKTTYRPPKVPPRSWVHRGRCGGYNHPDTGRQLYVWITQPYPIPGVPVQFVTRRFGRRTTELPENSDLFATQADAIEYALTGRRPSPPIAERPEYREWCGYDPAN